MHFKNYLNVYCCVFANRKYQLCMETQSIALCLLKGAVFPGVILFKPVLDGFYLLEPLQFPAPLNIRKSEFP